MYEKNALNNFKDVLGKYCAINQFIELSKRCFVAEHQKEIQKRDTFVKLATEYSITLTNYDADAMVTEICRSYIVNVHLCFETFLKDVCQQINKCGKNEYKPRIQEESYLACAVRNICGNSISDDMKPLYELCEYYRLIRNSSVHDLCMTVSDSLSHSPVRVKFMRCRLPQKAQSAVCRNSQRSW